MQSVKEGPSHIDSAVLRKINHPPRQVPVPEESLIRPLPRRTVLDSLTPILQVLLPLHGIREVQAVRVPHAPRLETLLDERDELLLDRVVEDG